MTKPAKRAPLTPQETVAVDAYLQGKSQKDSLALAKYSQSTIDAQAHRFFRRPKIVEAIERLLDPVMTAREVLHRLGDHARSGDAQVSLRALELLGKKHKLFTDKVEASGDNGGPISIRIVRDGV